MSAKHVYKVTLFSESFDTLEEAKWNVKIAFTPQEAKKLIPQCEYIAHFIGDKLHSVTDINVDKHGNITFGRTRKVYKV